MKRTYLKRKMRASSLLLLTLGMIMTTLNFNSLIFTSDDNLIDNDLGADLELLEELNMLPESADYSSSYSNTGANINVVLHQSYEDASLIEISNVSNSLNNTFGVPHPTVNNFNSTFTNITIHDIYAPNYTLVVEDSAATSGANIDTTNPGATSFTVAGDGYIHNVSIEFWTFTAEATQIKLALYNATWDGSNHKPGGANQNDYTDLGTHALTSFIGNLWYEIDIPDTFLNNSKTVNNTWFIGIFEVSGADEYWNYRNDPGAGGDDGYDETDSWLWNLGSWGNVRTYDFSLVLDLIPINNTPNPEDIDLKINGSGVTGYPTVNGTGYWENNSVFDCSSNTLNFTLSAEWWNVECNITSRLVNYTKDDITGASVFDVQNSQDVTWNVTSEALNYFDVSMSNFYINYTIPEIWDNINVFNGITNKTDDISTRSLGNGYEVIKVLNADDGTFWFLNGTSTNLITSIDTMVNSNPFTMMNFTNLLELDVNFIEDIDDGSLNLTIYTPGNNYYNYTLLKSSFVLGQVFSMGIWNISNNATEYGIFKIQAYWDNGTAAGLFEQDITILGETDLYLISPEDMGSYYTNRTFDIIIYLNDTGKNTPIAGAAITDDAGIALDPFVTNGTNGYYTAQVNTSKFSYGWNTIEINASDTNLNNQSINFTFQVQINTTISPSNAAVLPTVILGTNTTYRFNYSSILGVPVNISSWERVSSSFGMVDHLENEGSGNYTMHLNTSGVDVASSPFIYIFNISATGNETQVITLTVSVTLVQTDIEIVSQNASLYRKCGYDQSIRFYFNDTDNTLPISGLTANDIFIKDNQTGGKRSGGLGDHNWTIVNSAPAGYYTLNVSILGLDFGWVRLELNISLLPNYNWTLEYVDFYLIGNASDTNMVMVNYTGNDDNVEILQTGNNNSYEFYSGNDIYIEFNMSDPDDDDKWILGQPTSYSIMWYNTSNPNVNGTFGDTLTYSNHPVIPAYGTIKGILSTSGLSIIGNESLYTINITIQRLNYEDMTFSFNITILKRINVRITAVEVPETITAGTALTITFLVEYQYNETTWYPLEGVKIIGTLYVDSGSGLATMEVKTAVVTTSANTNAAGRATLTVEIPGTAINIRYVITLDGAFNLTSSPFEVPTITVDPPFGIEDLLPWIILIVVAVGAAVGIYGVYKGVIIPKKQKKERILTEVKTIFDDAINLEHTLVLYKGTGTCIFFKSFGTEEIDPELISGFLTAVGSFGKEMESQQALNEITYGDKTLLLADGEHIRVALVLGKKASVILRQHLQEFITAFEKQYDKELPNWRGQLDLFKDAGGLIDDKLNTSIILPHEITYEHSNVKSLKNPDARGVLKIANELVEDTDRKFFFIATLLKEAVERTGKENSEIFMGIKELRDKKILMPIEISSIEEVPVSEQEINLIFQRVGELPNLSDEEKQALATNLAQLGPVEREAYLVNLAEQQEIVSAPVKKGGPSVVDSAKAAKKEISNLLKLVKAAKKEKDYKKAVDILQNAANIANTWDLTKNLEELQDNIRLTVIEDLRIKMKSLEDVAKIAVKEENFSEAAQKYKVASEMANEIFKLGVTEMTKELKRLSNKAKEYERLS